MTNSYNYQTTDCDTLLKTLQWTVIERRQQIKITYLYKARNKLLHIPLNHLNSNKARAGCRGDYVIQVSNTSHFLCLLSSCGMPSPAQKGTPPLLR